MQGGGGVLEVFKERLDVVLRLSRCVQSKVGLRGLFQPHGFCDFVKGIYI